jgi:hypothetical protein
LKLGKPHIEFVGGLRDVSDRGERWSENSGDANLTAAFKNDGISDADHISLRTVRSSRIQIPACDRHRRQSLPIAALMKAAGTMATSLKCWVYVIKLSFFDTDYSRSETVAN